jgi:hypothetical protein
MTGPVDRADGSLVVSNNSRPTTTSSSSSSHPQEEVGASTSTTSSIFFLTPNPEDILLGRGKPYQSHLGNEAMRQLVEKHKDRYNSLPRDKRGLIANQLLHKIIEDGGSRFLKKQQASVETIQGGKYKKNTTKKRSVEQGWVLATRGEAYEKLCHALRSKGSISSTTSSKNEQHDHHHSLSAPQFFAAAHPRMNGDIAASASLHSTTNTTSTQDGPAEEHPSSKATSAGRRANGVDDVASDEGTSAGAGATDIAVRMAIKEYLTMKKNSKTSRRSAN